VQAPGTLHLVPVPLGDDRDVTLRALEVLRAVPLVAAEDTRVARALLKRLGIDPPRLLSFHDHNEAVRVPQLLAVLAGGSDVAVVADAGTPVLNDPGFRLVRAALDAGLRVVSLPGPSAPVAALAWAAIAPAEWRFVGYLPRQAARRRALLERVRDDPATLVAFEAPHRILESLGDVAAVLGERPLALARDLSKPAEELLRGSAASVAATLAAEPFQHGELTLVVQGADPDAPPADLAPLDAAIDALLHAGVSPRVVRDALAPLAGLARRDVYARVLARRASSAADA
jgi:16S rRNA (cytidine1402-2'-O)-methyltransferase